MHEYSVVSSLIALCEEHAKKIKPIRLKELWSVLVKEALWIRACL